MKVSPERVRPRPAEALLDPCAAAALAMAAAGLQRVSGGRFALWLGASSPPLVEGLHGLTWEQPVERMRTTLISVRSLLRGDRLPLDREGVRPLRLGATPDRPVPIGRRLATRLSDPHGTSVSKNAPRALQIR